MRLKTTHPIAALVGRHPDSDLVYYERNGRPVARAYVRTPQPQTPDQLLTRAYQSAAARHWATLTQAQRDSWDAYARHRARRLHPTTAGAAPLTGYLLFRKVQYLRQAAGLPLSADAPTLPPPATPAILTQLPAPNESTLHFQLTYPNLSSQSHAPYPMPHTPPHLLRVDLTPAMPTPSRRPRPTDFRLARHLGPDSFLPLQPSGATYLVPNIRFPIAPGQRFALQLTILTPEGVPGRPLLADIVRLPLQP